MPILGAAGTTPDNRREATTQEDGQERLQVCSLPLPILDCVLIVTYKSSLYICRSRQEAPIDQPRPSIEKTTPKATQVTKQGSGNIKIDSQPPFMAGGLKRCYATWASLTSDRHILQTIAGFRLDFIDMPYQNSWPRQLITTASEITTAQLLIDKFLTTNVIERTAPHRSGFMSNIFLREKRNGSFRMILNLKPLNPHVHYEHFKMSTLNSALHLITKDCYMASIDLADAYYSISVAESHRKYLQFQFQGYTYQFTCMANGISSAPRTFTKLLKVPLSHLRQKHNITITAYLDDLLLIAQSREKLIQDIDITLDLLISLGFKISGEKSALIPSQTVQFLGFTIDSKNMKVTLGLGKPDNIKHFISEVLPIHRVQIRTFASLVGKLAATLPANQYGQIFLKRLETAKAKALLQANFSYEGMLTMTQHIRQDLLWWLANIDSIYRPIVRPNPHITIYTDASFLGWGCHIPSMSLRTGGRWDPSELGYDINYLELKAVLFSLQSACREIQSQHILIRSDNTTTVVGINRQGSTHSYTCNNVSRDIWLWAMEHKNWLSATHCPGSLNIHADYESRVFNDCTEWTLNFGNFESICELFGRPSIDLFASRLNYQVSTYCAWVPDPGALAVDAFTINWADYELIYLFPPFSVIGRALHKIHHDQAEAIIVVPDWPTQPWYSQLRQMLQMSPMHIPVVPGTLHLPHDKTLQHPMEGKLNLLVCRVSPMYI